MSIVDRDPDIRDMIMGAGMCLKEGEMSPAEFITTTIKLCSDSTEFSFVMITDELNALVAPLSIEAQSAHILTAVVSPVETYHMVVTDSAFGMAAMAGNHREKVNDLIDGLLAEKGIERGFNFRGPNNTEDDVVSQFRKSMDSIFPTYDASGWGPPDPTTRRG